MSSDGTSVKTLTIDVLLGLSLSSMPSMGSTFAVAFLCFRFLDLDLERDRDRPERGRLFFFFLRGDTF